MSNMKAPSNAPSLLELPNELLQSICENLTRARDVSAFTRLCQRTFHLLISYLYRYEHSHLGGHALGWAIQRGRLETVQRATDSGTDLVTPHHVTLAASLGHTDIFMTLWSCKKRYGGFKTRDQDEEGTRALEVAVASGRLSIAKVLLEDSTDDLERRDGWGHTPLYAAAHNGDSPMVSLLLQHGADVTAPGDDGRQPLSVASAPHTHFRCPRTHIRTGSRANFLEAIEMLLRHGADIDHKERNGRTSLHEAAKAGHCDVVELLARHGADVNTQTERGQTPLHTVSLFSGKLEMAKLLVQLGADVTALTNQGRNPLWMSRSARDKEELARFLFSQGAKPVTDDKGHNPLHESVGLRCAPVVELMLSHGADINAADKDGVTPLHRAIEVDRNEETIKLLIRHGANVTATSTRGETPLGLSMDVQSSEIIELLLKNGADPNVLTRFGSPVLHEAIGQQSIELTEMLLNHGANPSMGNEWAQTSLFKAARVNNVHLMELVVKYGAKIDAMDVQKQTALSYAAWAEAPRAMEWLVQKGAKVNTKDHLGRTPLHKACHKGRRSDSVALLLKHGADVDATDQESQTAVNISALHGHADVVKILLQHRADWTIANNSGNTPLMSANLNGQTQVAGILTQWINNPNHREGEGMKRDPKWLGKMKDILRGSKTS